MDLGEAKALIAQAVRESLFGDTVLIDSLAERLVNYEVIREIFNDKLENVEKVIEDMNERFNDD